MNVSDKISVIYDGTIVGTVIPQETSEQALGLMMAGHSKDVAEKKALAAEKDGDEHHVE